MTRKFTLTISDMTEDEALDTFAQLSGMDKVVGGAGDHVAEEAPTLTVVQEQPVEEPVVDFTSIDFELDKTGLPWDERIHSSNQKMTAKGVWQRRRGVQDVEFDRVCAELRGDVPAPSVEVPAVEPVVSTIAPIPQAASIPAAVPPVAPPLAETRDFSGLMAKISELMTTNKAKPDYAMTIVQRINGDFDGAALNVITDVAAAPDMVEYAWQCIDVDTQAGVIAC